MKKFVCSVQGQISNQECWHCYYTNGSNFASRAECKKANQRKINNDNSKKGYKK